MSIRSCFRWSLVLVFVAVSGIASAAPPEGDRVDFGRDIRPLLSDRCFHCHGPDEKHREEGLRFDTKDGAMAALESGGYAIVPGKPDESVILERLISDDPDERMPPADSNKPALTKEQVELFRKWIAQGANWQQHWSFLTPTRPAAPKVEDTKWAVNGIDPFIFARLEREGLKPSGPATKEVLIRRVTFDLTGLPPTPTTLK